MSALTPAQATSILRATVAKYQILHDAMVALAGDDTDYARERNNVGFNKFDCEFGHALAEKSPYQWTPKMRAGAYKLARKYQRQLSDVHGIDFATIPQPPVVTDELTAMWYAVKRLDRANR